MTMAERYLSFAVPPVISSSEFTTEFLEYQPSGSVKTFTAGDAFTISLANLNKAQYLLPDSCFLTFDVVVEAPQDTNTTPGTGTEGEYQGPYQTIDNVPRPRFGCPYFESVSVSVPGSASFDAMPSSAEETSAYWYSTRLLASSVSSEGTHRRPETFKLPGRYNFAGGKSGIERQGCITGARRISEPGAVLDETKIVVIRGAPISYSVPLSAFCTLFSKSSSLIPIGMLSSGGEALVFQYTVARSVDSVLGTNFQSGANTGFASPTFKMINPRIVCSVVRIQNPTSVAQLSALYDARVKMALPGPTAGAPPMELAVPMVVAHKRFVWARSVIPGTAGAAAGSSSNMALTFSGVNEPSVSAVVIRMRYRPSSLEQSIARRRRAGVYLGSDEPPVVIKDLQLRINDQLVPLKGISDDGITNIPVYTAGDPPTVTAGAGLLARTSGGLASTLFDIGRHGMGLFMEEDHCKSLTDVVFDKTTHSFSQVTGRAGLDSASAPVFDTPYTLITGEADANYRTLTEASPTAAPSCTVSPIALFVIPLASFPQLVGDYSNAHTLRSWDLRSVSSFTVSATVQVENTQEGPANQFRFAQAAAPQEDVICDGALICDGMLRLAAGSSDARYQYTAVANATVAAV